VGTEFYRSGIQSKRRFTYEEVDEFLADRAAWQDQLAPDVHRLLGDMHELAMLLRRRRFANGSLEMMLPEVKLDLDRTGQVTGARTVANTESHQIIEEFMLAANVAIATRLSDLGYHVLRRIHAPPSLRRLSELTQFVNELGIPVESLQDRFEIKRVLEETADSPLRHAVHFAVLRSMQKAVYGPKDEGHFALNFPHYCHFTSPIRRYPDLVIHRMVGAVIDGRRPRDEFAWLTGVGEHCSDREQNAEQAERELVKLKLLTYFAQKVGQEMVGVITGVESFGMFVQGVDIPAEGMVTVPNMPDDQYYYDDRARLLMGRSSRNQYRLGDQVLVKIQRVDLVRRQLDLVLLEKFTPSAGPRATKRRSTSRPSERGKPGPAKRPRKGRRP
jgi:ribonuclease R